MSKRRLWKNLGALLLILCLVLVYCLVYLLPALVDINRCRREIKDVTLRIQDLKREVSGITFSDQREKKLFRRAGNKFGRRFPVLKNRSDRNKWLKRLTDFIKDTAGKQGISGLLMMDDLQVSRSLIQMGLPDNHEIFDLMRDEIRNHSVAPADVMLPHSLLLNEPLSGKTVRFRVFFLGFQAPVSSGFRMMAELVNFPFQLEFGEIRLIDGSGKPEFLLKFRVFYCQDKSPDREVLPTDQDSGNFIDLNSPLLLKPVYLYFSTEQRKIVVPDVVVNSIFRSNMGDRR